MLDFSDPEYYLDLLRGQIDISRVPFSDRGSRLVLQQGPGRSTLQLNLGERLTALNPHPEAYLRRPALVPALEFIGQQGDALPFEASGSPDLLSLQTRLGRFKIVFQDEETLAISLPPQVPAGIRFSVNSQLFRIAGSDETAPPLRNIIYATNGDVLSQSTVNNAAGTQSEFVLNPGLETTILLRVAENPSIPEEVLPFRELEERATARWREWFGRVPPVASQYVEKYAYAWWVMANNMVSPRGQIKFECMAPSKASYIGLWLWDNAFHAIAYRHVDPELARNQIRAFLALQQEDGMLPDAIFDEAGVFELDHPVQGKVTKPPILAWASLKIHDVAPDLDFLREIYPALARINSWWLEYNDDDADGLAQYNHPYSSGLDDSPLWDYGMPVESPDLNTYLFHSMRSLERIARLLKLRSEAAAWRKASDAIVQRMLEYLWDEEAGSFRAIHNEQPIPVLTPFNLLPLWTGRLPARVNKKLLANLTDESKFWGGYMLPTVARDEAAYDPETMWRGPVWANINYFFIEALEQAKRPELAQQLCEATLNMIMSQPGVHEYYNPETGLPPIHSVPAFGWTAALFIDLAIQASRENSDSSPQRTPGSP
jgi:glycogen debranching enzyme